MASTTSEPRTLARRSARRLVGTLVSVVTSTALGVAPAPAGAATVLIDASAPGADYDAILDGFPGLAPYDGTADFGGNALAVSLKDGVTEERAIVELPLAAVVAAGGSAHSVVSAVVTFNIDDALSTFGPGTDFDGTAAERIYVSTYAGNGVADLDDYARGAAAGTITTGPHGSITDAVLASGPITFALDVTAAVRSLLEQGATHLGLVFATDDTPTGTSIDDLGVGGGGAPGADGARLPFVTVEIAEATPTPAPTAAPTPPPTVVPTATAAPTPTPGPTASPGATPSPGPTATPAPTATPGTGPTATPGSATPTPGAGTPTPVPTGGPTPTAGQATPAPSGTASVTPTAGVSPGPSATPAPSTSPGAPTVTPGTAPTPGATAAPTPTPFPILTPRPRDGAPPAPSPTAGSTVPEVTALPDASGDQLVFFYDARPSFTTFVNLHNLGDAALEVLLVLHDEQLGQPVEQQIALAAGATRTIDVGELRAAGLGAHAGVGLAVAVDRGGAPIVTRALEGSFTVANLSTGSAWGAPAAARRAVRAGGTLPSPGTAIDGTTLRLRGIRPERVALPVYYDPATLEPASAGGNQLVFLSFDDATGVAPTAAATSWSLDARRADGEPLNAGDVEVAGVSVTHLEALLGGAANGAAGSITFGASGAAANRLVFFTESLGTFATGYLLPPVAP